MVFGRVGCAVVGGRVVGRRVVGCRVGCRVGRGVGVRVSTFSSPGQVTSSQLFHGWVISDQSRDDRPCVAQVIVVLNTLQH